MEYEIRNIREEELEAFTKSLATGFGWDYNPEHLEQRKKIFEFDRNFATFDGPAIVGTAGIFSYQMSVPGGVLGCAGVTMVTVRSTHRRQGVLTGMMRKQLEEVHERGEPLAALWASEASIYGRFGYGLAIQSMNLKLPREWSALGFGTEAAGRVRLATAEEAKERWPKFHERMRLRQPGWVTRSEPWWEVRVFGDPTAFRDGFTANYYAEYEDDGELCGYARYRIKQNWGDHVPGGLLRIEELAAETPGAYTALWRHITSVDLIRTIEMENASVDEPLYWMLADSRRLKRETVDSIWLRLVDIEHALAGRRYAVEGRMVLAVRDPFLPWCDGNFEVEGGPDGAVCRATSAPADIRLSASDLGAAYLGGARLETLRRAGRVQGEVAAVRKADLMLSWLVPPHCPEHF
ncbi:MAG: GNAT family N-acetyltransferase [Tepidiformaceae bacterium]